MRFKRVTRYKANQLLQLLTDLKKEHAKLKLIEMKKKLESIEGYWKKQIKFMKRFKEKSIEIRIQ